MIKKLFLCILIVVACVGAFLSIMSDEEKVIDVSVQIPATPTPEPEPDYERLRMILTGMLADKEGDWSLCLKDCKTGDTISINSHQVYSASLIKLFVAETAYNQEANGVMKITDTTEGEIRKMLTYSDNDAWSDIAKKIGGGSYTNGMNIVTRTAQNEGFADTGQFFQGQHKNYNFTSVNDCCEYLERVLNGTIVSPEYSEKILNYLKEQQHTQKLPSGVPEYVETANKTGELDYVQGDAAIVYAPSRTYILVMIGDSLNDAYNEIPFFGEMSEVIYEYLEE